jgi:preprotein translocase SecE subunit
MAITKQSQSLADAEIEAAVVTKKKPEISDDEKTNLSKKARKKGFIRSAIAELRLVEWPTFGYVINWSIVVIIFTLTLAVAVGGLDHVFDSGVKFLTCTSPQSGKQSVGECGTNLLENLTLRNN